MPYNTVMMYYLDLFGVAVFAITGSLAAGRKRFDLLGVVVLAILTALGGGTIRDVLLGATPVFWIRDITYIVVSAGTGVIVFVLSRVRTLESASIRVPDAFGLAVFTVIGAKVAMGHDVPWIIAVMMGMMTGVAGGMLRDVLSGEIPLVLRKEVYATASMCGALVYVGLSSAYPEGFYGPVPAAQANTAAGVFVTLALRLIAIRWALSLPVFRTRDGA
jgi:uncharacterized membrane protein YeiH